MTQKDKMHYYIHIDKKLKFSYLKMCGRKSENRKDYVFPSHRKYIFESNIKLSQMLVVIHLCEASHVVRLGLIDFSGEINIRLFQFVCETSTAFTL